MDNRIRNQLLVNSDGFDRLTDHLMDLRGTMEKVHAALDKLEKCPRCGCIKVYEDCFCEDALQGKGVEP